jgi:hypothetical protein
MRLVWGQHKVLEFWERSPSGRLRAVAAPSSKHSYTLETLLHPQYSSLIHDMQSAINPKPYALKPKAWAPTANCLNMAAWPVT